ncbi:MAG: TIGR04282 family arsenosugar biosynthesis glycosyltransferase [Ginsengibacter sp.]
MKQSALIIFVRNPVLGKVKSRLAATLGKEKALEIYKILLAHTHAISKIISADKFIFYDDFINRDDVWENDIYNKLMQEGNSLGERMRNAFKKLFNEGYNRVIIIGSDCYELTTDIVTEGYGYLLKNEIVVGPAADGGYYLLGMNNFTPELFDNKNWGSRSVYIDTIDQIKKLNYKVALLKVLNDVDVEDDIDLNNEKLKELF